MTKRAHTFRDARQRLRERAEWSASRAGGELVVWLQTGERRSRIGGGSLETRRANTDASRTRGAHATQEPRRRLEPATRAHKNESFWRGQRPHAVREALQR